jgi:hypothetical protein
VAAATVVVVFVVVTTVVVATVVVATAVAGGGGLGHLGRWFGGSQMMGSTFAVLTTTSQGKSAESGVFEETLLPIFAASVVFFRATKLDKRSAINLLFSFGLHLCSL